ncbi:MAG: 2-hydroxychromene-2-carboxylate isomerase [Myxococcales bacterium]|nr:2-hydroxychromene-2-carboxylate isomerase [Myxococcales bacterium]
MLQGMARAEPLGEIEFFFDFLSPYAFLAWHGVQPLAAKHDRTLKPKPLLLAALLNHWGTKGPAETPAKARFVFLDCARRARSRELEFRCPVYHPFNPLLACRLATQAAAGDDQIAVIGCLWEHGWQRGGDLGDPDSLRQALSAAGLNAAELMERARSPEAKQELRNNSEEALERSVFGVPTMFLGESMYWGFDQLDLVDAELSGEPPLRLEELVERLPKGASASR